MKAIPRFLTLVAFLFAFGQAQPLASLVPAESFLTLSASQQSSVYDSIKDDMAALDWDKAKTALTKLLAFLGANADSDFLPVIDVYEAIISGDYSTANAQLLEFCPAYQSVIDKSEAFLKEQKFIMYDALLSVGASNSSPIPAATALMRITGEDSIALYDDMFTTLLACAQEVEDDPFSVTTLEQDDATLYVLGDGGDLPLIIVRLDNLYVFSTNPDAARAVVRLANGAEEENLAGTAFYEKSASLGQFENSVGLSLDFGAIANLLESFAPMITEDDAGMTYVVERALAMFRTLGVYAGHMSATPEGLESEFLFATNPDGGDAELLDMITCSSCKISSPFLAPRSANSVSSAYIPIRELISYADSWVRGYGEATESAMSIGDLSAEFGFDLDTLLLDWVGSELHSFVLKPYNRDAGDLFYGLPQVSVMPVSSPEAAQTGLDALGDSLFSVIELASGGGFSSSERAMFDSLNSVALRSYDYAGTTINRVQYSFNGDMGYAFIDNYLVFGTPSNAIEMLIDTYQGSATILEDADYQTARERAPDTLTVFAHSQDKANYQGLAKVLELVTQPLAASLNTALQVGLSESYVFEPYGAYLEDVSAQPFDLGLGSQDLMVSKDDADEYGYLNAYFELNNLTAGETVTIDMNGEDYDFYPYAYIVDIEDNMYIAESEYSAFGESLSFTPEEGKTYWLELRGSVNSYDSFSPYDAYIIAVEPEPISETNLEVTLGSEDADVADYITKYYELTDFAAGDTLTIALASDDFFPNLSLIDQENELVVAEAGYGADDTYSLSYTLEEGKTYWIEVYGSLYDSSANYTLEVSRSEEAAESDAIPLSLMVVSETAMIVDEIVEMPSYADLLDTADLIPQIVEVIADHMSTSESYSYIEGNNIISRSKTFFRW